jgi:hypothetical protein
MCAWCLVALQFLDTFASGCSSRRLRGGKQASSSASHTASRSRPLTSTTGAPAATETGPPSRRAGRAIMFSQRALACSGCTPKEQVPRPCALRRLTPRHLSRRIKRTGVVCSGARPSLSSSLRLGARRRSTQTDYSIGTPVRKESQSWPTIKKTTSPCSFRACRALPRCLHPRCWLSEHMQDRPTPQTVGRRQRGRARAGCATGCRPSVSVRAAAQARLTWAFMMPARHTRCNGQQ